MAKPDKFSRTAIRERDIRVAAINTSELKNTPEARVIRQLARQIEQLSQDLKGERLAWFSQFPGLNQDILAAIKP